MKYSDEVEDERDDDQIVVVIPEFVPAKWWEKILHNHSGLMLKFALMRKRNVVVCNIRYFLEPFSGPVTFRDDPNASPPEQSQLSSTSEAPLTMPDPPVVSGLK